MLAMAMVACRGGEPETAAVATPAPSAPSATTPQGGALATATARPPALPATPDQPAPPAATGSAAAVLDQPAIVSLEAWQASALALTLQLVQLIDLARTQVIPSQQAAALTAELAVSIDACSRALESPEASLSGGDGACDAARVELADLALQLGSAAGIMATFIDTPDPILAGQALLALGQAQAAEEDAEALIEQCRGD